MINMKVQSVRAKVIIGSIILKTPYVKAFTVTRQRGVLWASASITLELPASSSNNVSGGDIKIYATVDNDTKLLFTGYVNTVDITPSMSKYGTSLLNITAYDKLYKLRLLKINRRIQVSPGDVWCSITGVTRKKSRSTSTRSLPESYTIRSVIGDSNYGDPDYDPLDKKAKKDLSTMDKKTNIKTATNGVPPEGPYPGEGVPVHTHDGYKQGGPALGTFGDYEFYSENKKNK